MTIDEVYQFFGSASKGAKSIGVTRQCFFSWIKQGYIPLFRQKSIELLTKGALIAKKEDTNKWYKEDDNNSYYLPIFRYYDKKYGMCPVESIQFRKGKQPKITCKIPLSNVKKFSVFTTENLMQAVNLFDTEGKILYEGDICRLKTGKKMVFEKIEMVSQFKKIGKFKIIGSVFE